MKYISRKDIHLGITLVVLSSITLVGGVFKWPGVVIPRKVFDNLYNSTYPSIFEQSILYFFITYIVSFLTYMLIDWMKSSFQTNKKIM